jgi:hypothetical protein
MSNPKNDAAVQLQAVLDALLESIEKASDEEITRVLVDSGIDPLKVDELMKFAKDKAVDSFYAKRRAYLAQQREERLNGMSRISTIIPESREGKLMMLTDLLASNVSLKGRLTTQFRELTNPESMSDEELAGILRHLIALGVTKEAREG